MKKKIIAIVLIIILSLVISFGAFIYSKQAPWYEDFTVNVAHVLKEGNFRSWLSQYLDNYMDRYNFRSPIESYRIESLEEIEQPEPDESTLWFHVVIKGQSKERPNELLKVLPTYESGTFVFDTILRLDIEDQIIKYGNDETLQDYELRRTPERGHNDIREFYSQSNNYLQVRENKNSDWVETPILSKDFLVQFQGWNQEDARLYFKGDIISFIHQTGNVRFSVTTSFDKGETWNTAHIDLEDGLDVVGYAKIEYVGDTGYLVTKSHVAINSDIQLFHKTTDKGKTWKRGEYLNRNSHLKDFSVLDNDRVFFTEQDNPNLFVSEDFGSSAFEIKLPKTDTIEGPYKDSGLEWEVIFKQAYPPFEENGKYYMHLGVGDNNDFKQEVAIKYVSEDKGLTWKFDSFKDITKVEEEIN